jgi:hypothetical protein
MKNTCNNHTNNSVIFVEEKTGIIIYYSNFFMVKIWLASFCPSVN